MQEPQKINVAKWRRVGVSYNPAPFTLERVTDSCKRCSIATKLLCISSTECVWRRADCMDKVERGYGIECQGEEGQHAALCSTPQLIPI